MKLIFEGMEESGSVDLDKFIKKEKDQFFAGIDCMCISGALAVMIDRVSCVAELTS